MVHQLDVGEFHELDSLREAYQPVVFLRFCFMVEKYYSEGMVIILKRFPRFHLYIYISVYLCLYNIVDMLLNGRCCCYYSGLRYLGIRDVTVVHDGVAFRHVL